MLGLEYRVLRGQSGLGGSSHEDVSVVLRIHQDSHVKLRDWASSV